MKIHNWFLPHKETHKKAHLISWQGIIIWILLFILLQVSFSIVSFSKPGVLGTTTHITLEEVIELTNKERQKEGLPPLVTNTALENAAKLKAENMFSENYWAHFAPSGKTPWDFILGSGYKFSFAGENLAKNFYTPKEVVSAWMASPTHRENLLNPKYKDIGIAVEDGVLNGQKTTLVIQMFGTTSTVDTPIIRVAGKNITVERDEYENIPALITSAQTKGVAKPLIDPYQVTKSFGLGIILLIVTLLALDFIILKRRGVFRLSSHNIGHAIFLSGSMALIAFSNPGVIL